MPRWRNVSSLLVVPLFLLSSAAFAQGRTVKGTVVDSATRQGLGGATVAVQGPSQTVVTEPDGSFKLERAPDAELVLSVEATGYSSKEVTLPPGTETTRVALAPKSGEEEIVVTGRASGTRRKNVAVAITKVKAEELT